ncbi:HpcH/HpaI aldolase/citrate lyase family protein [Microvirga makkahensis]|uniref:CoA ester lyase n=1 Tax=Microvirga makkahensis TaxID=1128670 RepID=A0A7X3SMZ4_9HYPH|nr:CoA ester lyase [Microvirga makkahensis]MXQ10760.1 CoA ester lyase [Microvirga makkahensis]
MKSRLAACTLPLFVPADRTERFPKAAAAGPDAIVIDLEDAVAAENKVAARDGLAGALAETDLGGLPILLRVNATHAEWAVDDLAAASRLPLDAIILPKAETAGDILAAGRASGLPVIALVETARGLRNIFEIAEAADRIAFGSIDFAADLNIGHTREALLFARAQIVLASRCAGKPAPIDGVTTEIRNEAIIVSDSRYAVEQGFGGKLLIHPAQIAPARHGFAPTEAEIDWAGRVLEAAASGLAAIKIDEAMVDAPVIIKARQIFQRAGKDV